ncbi:hypothetical protein FB567DRAFT_186270 [Paraphoma chrysanthemicola]|uniref:Uncharacterized protein n=1 Tax=Paraphoma chrysanthemicola TaxID=798071 RepID=A0A8K0QXF6_9PLEO|nr:hypothetical protein FB567DRAFT_186270 [Paraphoma chrysanthemicola]
MSDDRPNGNDDSGSDGDFHPDTRTPSAIGTGLEDIKAEWPDFKTEVNDDKSSNDVMATDLDLYHFKVEENLDGDGGACEYELDGPLPDFVDLTLEDGPDNGVLSTTEPVLNPAISFWFDSRAIQPARLFLPYVTASEVRQDIQSIYAGFSYSRPDITNFLTALRKRRTRPKAPFYPDFVANPTTWPDTNANMDELFDAATDGEPQITEADISPGRGTERSHLVKPFGSFRDPLAVFSSYPTRKGNGIFSEDYGVVNDMSNGRMFDLYAKLGFHRVDMRIQGMLHIDMFPRRFNRLQATGGDIWPKYPKDLRDYWENMALEMLNRSRALVVLVVGFRARVAYERFLASSGADTEDFLVHERTRHSIQLIRGPNGKILRMIVYVPHLECYRRLRSHAITSTSICLACSERLYDMVNVLVDHTCGI